LLLNQLAFPTSRACALLFAGPVLTLPTEMGVRPAGDLLRIFKP
jgi:hypothetical protein